MWSFSRPRADANHIFLAEMAAALVTALEVKDRGDTVLCVDNKPAVAAIVKGHSSNTTANEMLSIYAAHAEPPRVAWVSTKVERADHLTRNLPCQVGPCFPRKWRSPRWVPQCG